MAELIDVPSRHRFDQKKLWRYLKAHLEDFGVQPTI